jgi:hypothetical protein
MIARILRPAKESLKEVIIIQKGNSFIAEN